MADARGLDNPREDEAKVISRHLDPQFTGAPAGVVDAGPGSTADDDDNRQSSLKLLGGDVHRDLYRIEARSKRAGLDQRAATFAHPPRLETDNDIDVDVPIRNEPGAFRRRFIWRNESAFLNGFAPSSFVKYLELYGSFAGEDLNESAEEPDAESGGMPGREVDPERRPLLAGRKSTPAPGDASDLKVFFTLFKAFIGTGIVFLPKAFRNGGILFSPIALLTVSIMASISFHLLLECRRQYGGGYGDIGDSIGGGHLRTLIRVSVVTTQLGFVCAGIAFTAENMRSFVEGVAASHITPSIYTIVALVPLALIRKISRLGLVALVADVFIFFAIGYIYYYDISTISGRGFEPTVTLFDTNTYTMTIGSDIFMFEGIGLILPIQSSMSQPDHFDRILYSVMAIITFLFASVGILSYGAFGTQTMINVMDNFPQSDVLVNFVRLFFSLAVLVGTPVQLFPALRIMEEKIFDRASGRRSRLTKWKKNIFRTGIVFLCGLIAALGAQNLDQFVALVGSILCVPLIFFYPAYLHWKGIARSQWAKGADILIFIMGVVCMIYTTMVTLSVQFR